MVVVFIAIQYKQLVRCIFQGLHKAFQFPNYCHSCHRLMIGIFDNHACPKTSNWILLEQLLVTQNPWCKQLGKVTFLVANSASNHFKITIIGKHEIAKFQNRLGSVSLDPLEGRGVYAVSDQSGPWGLVKLSRCPGNQTFLIMNPFCKYLIV